MTYLLGMAYNGLLSDKNVVS